VQFEFAIMASQGARRGQEDAALACPACDPDAPPAVLSAVLCDGMGGHTGGALASHTASRAFLEALAGTEGQIGQRLMGALELANGAIANMVVADPTCSGMGSTLVGVQADASGLTWISVGDSLLYLWRGGEIMLLNADHSLAPEIDKLAASGKISWEAARNDPRRHYLRSALTGDEIELIDLAEQAQPLAPGDVVLVASDGIHTLDEATISAVIDATRSAGAEDIAKRLIAAVDAADVPHQDNTTVIAIRVLEARRDV
jgi:PPM family protein phosphatase